MQFSGQRVVLSGLALLPACAALLLPEAARTALLSALGLTGTLAVWTALAAAVVRLAARRDTGTQDNAPTSLLRHAALRRQELDLPNRAEMRQALQSVIDAGATSARGTPETAEQAHAKAISRVLDTWAVGTLHGLDPARLTEVYVFDRLLRATPDVAGTLAQLFENPSAVLDIRDHIAATAARHQKFERQRDAYEATLEAWTNRPSVPRPSALLLALQALDRPDIDLWHKVVLEHDPHDPAQREAALWCVRQPECDRATVASFLVFVAADGHLDTAARTGDARWLSGVRGVIEAWNAGTYTCRELGLEPADAVVAAAPVMADALNRLAQATGAQRWPDPRGLFAEYPGRALRPRDLWCLRTGRITAAPDPADYFDQAAARVA